MLLRFQNKTCRKNFVLGTAQLTQKYGITNFDRKFEKKKIIDLLAFAYKNDFTSFDTAPSYGSEKILGEFIDIFGIKKIRILTKIDSIKNRKNLKDEIIKSIEKSLKHINKIDTLFFHDPKDFIFLSKNLDLILNVKKTFKIKNVGFSIYDFKDLKILSNHNDFSVQLPLNLANKKFLNKKINSKNIYARSIFLQGLLINNKIKKNIPLNLKKMHKKYHSILIDRNLDPLAVNISFIKKITNLKNVLVGFDNIKQIKKFLNAKANQNFDENIYDKLNSCFDQKYLDPRKW